VSRSVSQYLADLDLKLSSEDHVKYKETLSINSFTKMGAYYKRAFVSEDYSHNFKLKLALSRPYLEESVSWGLENLKGEALSICIKQVITNKIIEQILSTHKMDFELAGIITQIWRSQQPNTPSTRWDLDVTPVLEWARTTYGLDESIPDSWVREFLSEGEES